MVRAWNENSFADSVLLICKIAAPASVLIPGCGASAASAAGPAGVSPISPKANSPKAVLVYRNVIMSLPPNMDDVHCCKTKSKSSSLRTAFAAVRLGSPIVTFRQEENRHQSTALREGSRRHSSNGGWTPQI